MAAITETQPFMPSPGESGPPAGSAARQTSAGGGQGRNRQIGLSCYRTRFVRGGERWRAARRQLRRRAAMATSKDNFRARQEAAMAIGRDTVHAGSQTAPQEAGSPRARGLSLLLLGSIIVSFLAASAAPTPLYAVYAAHWGFSPL